MNELEKKREQIIERISKIEKDLRSQLNANLEDQAIQLENREVLESLIRVERANLDKINAELKSLNS